MLCHEFVTTVLFIETYMSRIRDNGPGAMFSVSRIRDNGPVRVKSLGMRVIVLMIRHCYIQRYL